MIRSLSLPVAASGPLADLICVLGLLAMLGWLGWRFGPTIARAAGWASWWVAWACGSQGAYTYCAFFLVFGALAWGSGTLWYAKRRGRWPSALSARLFARLLEVREALAHLELPPIALPRRGR